MGAGEDRSHSAGAARAIPVTERSRPRGPPASTRTTIAPGKLATRAPREPARACSEPRERIACQVPGRCSTMRRCVPVPECRKRPLAPPSRAAPGDRLVSVPGVTSEAGPLGSAAPGGTGAFCDKAGERRLRRRVEPVTPPQAASPGWTPHQVVDRFGDAAIGRSTSLEAPEPGRLLRRSAHGPRRSGPSCLPSLGPPVTPFPGASHTRSDGREVRVRTSLFGAPRAIEMLPS